MSLGGLGDGSNDSSLPIPQSRTQTFLARLQPKADPRLQLFLQGLKDSGIEAALGQGSDAANFKAQLASLEKEPNAEIFFHSLYLFASSLEDGQKYEASALVFSALAQTDPKFFPISEETRAKAEQRWNASRGAGSFGGRTEFIFKRLGEETSSPTMLLSMTGASVLGRLSYAAFLTGAKSLETGAILGKGLAGLGSLLLEAPAFTFLHKGLNEAVGRPSSWAAEDLKSEILSSFIFLGVMKLAHFGGTQVSQKFLGAELTPDRLTALSRTLLPEASTLGGILAANQLEKRLHLKPWLKDETLWTDALSTLFQFKVSGHLSGAITGERFNRWLAAVEKNSENHPPPSGQGSPFFEIRQFATPDGFHFPHIFMAEKKPDLVSDAWVKNAPRQVEIRLKPRLETEDRVNLLNPPQLETLQDIAKEIEDPSLKAQSLATVGFEAERAGDPEYAKKLFIAGLKAAKGLKSPFDRSKALSQIALRQAQAGLLGLAQISFADSLSEIQMLEREFYEQGKLISGFQAYELATRLGADLMAARLTDQADRVLFKASRLYREFHHDKIGEATQDAIELMAERGLKTEPMAYLKKIPNDAGRQIAATELARIFVRRGDLDAVKELLPHIQNSYYLSEVHRLLALESLEMGSYFNFNRYRSQIKDPYAWILTTLKGSHLMNQSGHTLDGISLSIAARDGYLQTTQALHPVNKAVIHAMLARSYGHQGQYEEFRNEMFKVLDTLRPFLIKPYANSPEVILSMSELGVSMAKNFEQSTLDAWVEFLVESDRPRVWTNIALGLAEEGNVGQGLIYLSKVNPERRSVAQREFSKKILQLGHGDIAFAVADKITDPKERFDALYDIYRLREDSTALPPTNPPPAGGSERGGPAPSGIKARTEGKALENAKSLGSDASPPARRSALLWEPDLSFFAEHSDTPWLWEKTPAKSGPTPLFLELPPQGPLSTPHSEREILRAASAGDPPKKGPAQPNSDRPPPNEHRLSQDVLNWSQTGRGEMSESRKLFEAGHVRTLVQKIYDEMWRVMNFEAGTKLAYRIATGLRVTVRITALSPDLHDYKLEFFEGRVPQENFNQVQWTFDPGKGALIPRDYEEHGAWEKEYRRRGIDVSQYFIPFYRRLHFISEGLKSEHLLKHLSAGSQAMISEDPTVERPMAPVPEPTDSIVPDPIFSGKNDRTAPTLVRYLPLILAGVRQQVDTYAKYQELGPDGTRRLQKLMQRVIATLFERESRMDLKENQVLLRAPFLHIIIGPPEGPTNRRDIAVRTPKEGLKNRPGPEDVILEFHRTTGFSGEYEYPYLGQHMRFTDAQGFATGPDLAFQQYLGLKNPLHLRLDYLDLYPPAKDIDNWDAWMELNGFWKNEGE